MVWVLFSVFSVFCITYTSFGYCTRPQQCLFICTFTDKPTETRLTAPSKEAKEGEPFKITCTARANPTPVYQFYRDGKLIRRTSTGVLSFPSIKTEDAGTYRCVPTNEVGEGPEAIVTFTVTVKGKKMYQYHISNSHLLDPSPGFVRMMLRLSFGNVTSFSRMNFSA